MQRKRMKNITEKGSHYTNLQEAMNDFLKFKTAQGMSELTMRDYHNTFERFMRIACNTLSPDILKQELLEFLTPLADASPAKFNRPYSNLNSFLNWLIFQGVIEINPLLSIGLKKKRDEGRIRCIDVKYIKVLLDVINLKTYAGLRDYILILLMLDCGIRPCEAFKIELKDIDYNNDFLTIRKENAKTRTERSLPLSSTILDLLARIYKLKPDEWNNSLVFCSCDGLPMHVIMFDKRLSYYSRKAGVKITPYDLRHTFAILYLRNNGNAFTLQKTMGHADLSMTKRYLGISMDDLKEQHQKATPLHSIVRRNTRVRKIIK
ncbi:MAG: tyrosine-type recombinase/integrase [Ruminiclostridium sp.]|nr:tyrosine-type recombinase/integrase [Ruminiclostridium sp.]